MAKIRYQLIRPLKPGPSVDATWQIYLKGLLALASISLIAFYSSYNRTTDQNFIIPTELIIVPTEIAPIHNVTNNAQIEKKIHSTMGMNIVNVLCFI